jgi:integrase
LKHHSRPMAIKVFQSFRSIIKEAKRRGLITVNIAEDIKIERKTREKVRLLVGRDIPTPVEIQKILAAAVHRWRALYTTAALAGLRASELRGLLWEHIDFAKNVIHVRQRADEKNKLFVSKSYAGQRDLPMPPVLAEMLQAWKEICPRKDGELWLVFPNGEGNVENHSNILNRGLYPLQLQDDVKITTRDDEGNVDAKYGLHSLRNFYASVLIEQGFSPKRVQILLGHESIQLTYDTYGHLFPSPEDDLARITKGAEWVMAGTHLRAGSSQAAQ